jgi:DNA-binding MarR family transcriptional regulator
MVVLIGLVSFGRCIDFRRDRGARPRESSLLARHPIAVYPQRRPLIRLDTVDREIVVTATTLAEVSFLVNYFLGYHFGMDSSETRVDAWRAVVTSHAAVTERIQRALVAADLPPLSWYEVLSAVKRSPTGRPRMSELAEWLTLSRGGITKLVDRLQEAGLLERVSCAQDRRSLQAQLTPAGERMLAEMLAIYEVELERHLQMLTPEEAELITAALHKVTGSTCDGARAAETETETGAELAAGAEA